jgi:hypothetical protein
MMLSILMTTLGHRDPCIVPSIDPSNPKIMPQILLITLVTKIPPLSLDRPPTTPEQCTDLHRPPPVTKITSTP